MVSAWSQGDAQNGGSGRREGRGGRAEGSKIPLELMCRVIHQPLSFLDSRLFMETLTLVCTGLPDKVLCPPEKKAWAS